MADRIGKPVSQRQLRVGEMIKQSLSMIFIRNEAKVPNLETNTITVTEVRMSQDLKIAKAYVLPLGGKDAEETKQKPRPPWSRCTTNHTKHSTVEQSSSHLNGCTSIQESNSRNSF